MPVDFFPRNVAVYGLGLLGGSLCMNLRKKVPGARLAAYGRSVERLRPALDEGTVDRIGTIDDADLCGADLVVVAMPVAASIDIIQSILGNGGLGDGALVIDVGSVKEEIVRGVIGHPRAGRFVGCHPMAGSEKTGYRNGREDLYEGSSVIITPHEKNEGSDIEKISQFWRGLGARTVLTSPGEHDALVARTSHLPHMVSCVLVDQLAAVIGDENRDRAGHFIGRGFKDMTRIAAGSEELWSEICMLNAGNITAAMDDLMERLAEVRRMISGVRENPDALNEYLAVIRNLREGLS